MYNGHFQTVDEDVSRSPSTDVLSTLEIFTRMDNINLLLIFDIYSCAGSVTATLLLKTVTQINARVVNG